MSKLEQQCKELVASVERMKQEIITMRAGKNFSIRIKGKFGESSNTIRPTWTRTFDTT